MSVCRCVDAEVIVITGHRGWGCLEIPGGSEPNQTHPPIPIRDDIYIFPVVGGLGVRVEGACEIPPVSRTPIPLPTHPRSHPHTTISNPPPPTAHRTSQISQKKHIKSPLQLSSPVGQCPLSSVLSALSPVAFALPAVVPTPQLVCLNSLLPPPYTLTHLKLG